MQFLEKLIPAFLKRIDRYLLLNKRMLWESQIHYVLFFGALGIGTATFSGLWYPLSTKLDLPDTGFLTFLVAIPAVIAMLFWGYKQYTYSIEREFGQSFWGMAQGRILLNVLAVGMMLTPVVVFPVIVHTRIGQLATPDELKKDMDALNIGELFLVSVDDYERSNSSFYDLLNCAEASAADDNCAEEFRYISNRYENYHSYYGISYPMAENEYETARGIFNTNQDIIDFANISDEDALAHIERYKEVFEKYGGRLEYIPSEVLASWRTKQYVAISRLSQERDRMGMHLNDITAAHRPMETMNIIQSLGIFFCIIFGFASLITTLKVATVREILLSAGTFGGLVVVGTIAALLSREAGLMNEEDFTLLFASVCYGIALVIAINIKGRVAYSKISAIAIVLTSLFTPALLLWTTLVARETGIMYISMSELTSLTLLLSGIGLYILFLFPAFHRRFRLLRALPQA